MYSLRNIILSLTYQDRINGPIEIRIANPGGKTDGHSPAMYWMRARSIPKFGAPFQKVFVLSSYNPECWGNLRLVQCILAYISDLNLWVIQERGKVGILT